MKDKSKRNKLKKFSTYMGNDQSLENRLDDKSREALSRVIVEKTTEKEISAPTTLEQFETSPAEKTSAWYKEHAEAKARAKAKLLQERSELKPVKIETIEGKKIGNGLTVYKIDLDGNIIDEFPSAKEASESLKTEPYTLSKFLNQKENERSHFCGFYWIHQKDYKSTFSYAKQTKYLKHLEKTGIVFAQKPINKPGVDAEKERILLNAIDYAGTNYRRDFQKDYQYAHNHKFGNELSNILNEKESERKLKEKIRILEEIKNYTGTDYRSDYSKEYQYAYNNGFGDELNKALAEKGLARRTNSIREETLKSDAITETYVMQLGKSFPGDIEEFKTKYPKEHKHAVDNKYLYKLEEYEEENENQFEEVSFTGINEVKSNYESPLENTSFPKDDIKDKLQMININIAATLEFRKIVKKLSKGKLIVKEITPHISGTELITSLIISKS